MRIKRLFFAVLAASMVLACSSCKEDAPESVNEALEEGAEGTVTFYVTDFDTFNPIVTKSRSSLEISQLIYDGLFEKRADLTMAPSLAENYSVSKDGLVWTVKLKSGVSWHNGKAFSSDDVIYTIDSIVQSESSLLKQKISGVSSWRAVGSDKVEFTLESPNPNFINHLDFPIVMQMTPCNEADREYIPVGTGAYMYSPLAADRMILLLENKNYHEQTKSSIKNIIVKTIPNPSGVMNALETREIEAVNIDEQTLMSYNPKGNVKIHTYRNFNLTFLGVNANRSFLSEKAVRQAISAFIDRETVIKNGIFSRGDATYLLIWSDSRYYTKQEKKIYMSAGEAEQLLNESGWVRGAENRYEKTVGDEMLRLSVNLLVNGENSLRIQTAEQIQKCLESNGIDVNIEAVSYSDYKSRVASGDYDLFLGEVEYDDDFDLSWYAGSKAKYSVGVDTQEFDALFAAIKSAAAKEEVDAAYTAAADKFASSVPIIPICFGEGAVAVNERIEISGAIVNKSVYRNMENWTAKENL